MELSYLFQTFLAHVSKFYELDFETAKLFFKTKLNILIMLTTGIQYYINSFKGLSRDIWLMSLMSLINRSGTIVIIFLTIYLTSELGFSKLQAGFAVSTFGMGSVAGAKLGGWLTDKIGYFKTMFWSLIISGALFFVLMYMTTFYSFCAMVFLVSMVGDSFRPAAMASVSAYSAPKNRNRSLSLYRMAINLGFSFGTAMAGLIMANFGYYWLFIIDGGTCILAAFFLYAFLSEKEDQGNAETDVQVDVSEASPYKDKLFLFFAAMIFIMAVAFMQLFSTVPFYLKEELQLTEDQVGWFFMLNGLIIVALEMPIVHWIEEKFEILNAIILGIFLISLGFFVYNMTGSIVAVTILSATALSVGEVISFPFTNSFALSRSVEGKRGEFMGLYSLAFSSAHILAPTLGFWIAEQFTFGTLWNLMGLLCVISSVGFVVLRNKVILERKEQQLQLGNS